MRGRHCVRFVAGKKGQGARAKTGLGGALISKLYQMFYGSTEFDLFHQI